MLLWVDLDLRTRWKRRRCNGMIVLRCAMLSKGFREWSTFKCFLNSMLLAQLPSFPVRSSQWTRMTRDRYLSKGSTGPTQVCGRCQWPSRYYIWSCRDRILAPEPKLRLLRPCGFFRRWSDECKRMHTVGKPIGRIWRKKASHPFWKRDGVLDKAWVRNGKLDNVFL